MVFFYFSCNQVFSNNISMFLAQTGLGDTVMSGNVSSVNTLVGAIGGLLVIPVHRLFKRQTLTVNAILGAIGAALIFTAGSIMPVFRRRVRDVVRLRRVQRDQLAVRLRGVRHRGHGVQPRHPELLRLARQLLLAHDDRRRGNTRSSVAADSFMVCAVLAAIVAVVSAVYFAKVKSPKAASAETEVQAG